MFKNTSNEGISSKARISDPFTTLIVAIVAIATLTGCFIELSHSLGGDTIRHAIVGPLEPPSFDMPPPPVGCPFPI